jgi:hypothetical protein
LANSLSSKLEPKNTGSLSYLDSNSLDNVISNTISEAYTEENQIKGIRIAYRVKQETVSNLIKIRIFEME